MAYRVCTSGCSFKYPPAYQPINTQTHTHTHNTLLTPHRDQKQLLIYVNDAENFASMEIWIQNGYRINTNALNIKSAIKPPDATYVHKRMNITSRSQPYTLTHDSLKDFWLHPMSVRFDKCSKDAFIYFICFTLTLVSKSTNSCV